jgi:hypothetical protein
MMQYLGNLRGTGTMSCGEEPMGAVSFEFDGYLTRPGQVVASGEIRMEADALNNAFGRRDLRLHTDAGQILHLRFSGKRVNSSSQLAHVDITEGLPPPKKWRRGG